MVQSGQKQSPRKDNVPVLKYLTLGELAQLVARCDRTAEARSSNLLLSISLVYLNPSQRKFQEQTGDDSRIVIVFR